MSGLEIPAKIKATVHSFLPDARVMLFGSRARGDYNKHSDYDVLIVTEQTYPPREKINWESKISKALVYSFRAPFDVIIQSKEEVESKKGSKGYLIYYALKDAVEI